MIGLATNFLKTAEVKERLRFQTAEATVDFLRRNGATPVRRGRELLWPTKHVRAIINRLQERNPIDQTL